VLKRPCTCRASWRLLRGKAAQPLSAHYQLDCDYGTALVAGYLEGEGDNPIYLCESHATAMAQSNGNRDSVAGVRAIDAQSSDSNSPPTKEDQVVTREFSAKPAVAASVPLPAPVGAPAPAFAPAPAAAPAEAVVKPAAKSVGRKRTKPGSRSPARDLVFGDSTKALVDETIWNIATGDYEAYRTGLQDWKTTAEAAEAAGGQVAIVHRKINEYTLKLETLLSESQATIRVSEIVDVPLERAMLEIIGSETMGDAAKDAAVDHLGAFQEWIKRGLGRDITPLQAHQLARAIGDRANWGAASSLPEEVKPAYRAVYTCLRKAMRATVPDAQELEERLTNLLSAKTELSSALATKLAPSESFDRAAAGCNSAADSESARLW
jgi:hypothetical protein